MADKKFTDLVATGSLAAADILAIAQSPFGAGTSKSITGTVLRTFASALSLPLAGGTLTGALLFTDNTYDIGATGATRPRTVYIATSAIIQLSGLGASPTDGLQLINSTAAAVGAQQNSSAIRLTGQGWGTTAGASQTTDWRIYNAPQQGATATNILNFDVSLNGGAFSTKVQVTSNGVLSAVGITSNGNLIAAAASGLQFVGRTHLKSSADGLLELFNAAETGFTRLNFGGTTSSFPALRRTTTQLDVVLADNSALTSISAQSFRTDSSNVNAQVGTTYTLVAADNGKVVTLNNAGAITLTVPAGLGAGFSCTIIQIGAGQVTVAASGTTVNSYGALTKIAGQHGAATLYAYVADTFNLAGTLSA